MYFYEFRGCLEIYLSDALSSYAKFVSYFLVGESQAS